MSPVKSSPDPLWLLEARALGIPARLSPLDLAWAGGQLVALLGTPSAASPRRASRSSTPGNVPDGNGDNMCACMRALVHAVEALPAQRRSVVISGAGDRRDEDIRQQTRILGTAFDEVVLYEDACQRGRVEGEVVALLREGLQGATKTRRVHEVKGEFNAIDLALDHLQPGDLCLILIDQVEEALAHIAQKTGAA